MIEVEVRGAYVTADGEPASGSVTFTPRVAAAHGTAAVMVGRRVRATLDEAGAFAVPLQATDDPDLSPTGWTYRVEEEVSGRALRTYDVEVPAAAAAAGIDLLDVAPASPADGDPTAFATLAALTAEASARTTADAQSLAKAQNLADLPSAATARVNLGLATAMTTRASRVIPLGDSIEATPNGWFAYWSVNGGKADVIRNAGVGGNSTSQMLARIQTDVLDYAPDVVVLGGATNDIGGGVSPTVTKANIVAMVAAVRAAGAVPLLRTTPPRDTAGAGEFSTTALARQGILTHNAWIREWAAAQGVDVLDIAQPVTDPATGGYLTGLTGDNIHPTETAHKAIADYLLAQPALPYLRGGFPWPRAVTDTSNLLANGVFVGDTNADGVANSWTVLGGSPTRTLTPAATGITGNWQRITAPDASTVSFGQDVSTGFAVGDTLHLTGRVRTSGVSSATVRAQPRNGSTAIVSHDAVFGATKALDGVFSLRFVVPATTTNVRFFIQNTTAAGWIELAEVSMRNLTALGV